MLDAIELPILLKAIDFIFDEGRKILEERRERRKAKDAPAPAEEKPAEAEPALPAVRNESKSAMETKAESKEATRWPTSSSRHRQRRAGRSPSCSRHAQPRVEEAAGGGSL